MNRKLAVLLILGLTLGAVICVPTRGDGEELTGLGDAGVNHQHGTGSDYSDSEDYGSEYEVEEELTPEQVRAKILQARPLFLDKLEPTLLELDRPDREAKIMQLADSLLEDEVPMKDLFLFGRHMIHCALDVHFSDQFFIHFMDRGFDLTIYKGEFGSDFVRKVINYQRIALLDTILSRETVESVNGLRMLEGDSERMTYLHYAALHYCTQCVPVLLEHGAKVDSLSDGGITPLFVVLAGPGNCAMAMQLVQAGADVTLAGFEGDEHGYSNLHFAAARCDLELVQAIVAGGVSAKAVSASQNSVLHVAMSGPDVVRVVSYLVDIGADATFANSKGVTPMHIAVGGAISDIQAMSEVVTVLLDNGASLEARDHLGETPLFWCSNLQVIRMLIDKFNAVASATNQEGMTPLQKYISMERAALEALPEPLSQYENPWRLPVELRKKWLQYEKLKETVSVWQQALTPEIQQGFQETSAELSG